MSEIHKIKTIRDKYKKLIKSQYYDLDMAVPMTDLRYMHFMTVSGFVIDLSEIIGDDQDEKNGNDNKNNADL